MRGTTTGYGSIRDTNTESGRDSDMAEREQTGRGAPASLSQGRDGEPTEGGALTPPAGIVGALSPYMDVPPGGEVLSTYRPLTLRDEQSILDERAQVMQAVVEEENLRRILAERARELGMHVGAFEKLLERDPRLAADILAEQAREEARRQRVGEVPGGAAINVEDLSASLRQLGRKAAMGDFDPEAIAAEARASIPVHGREVWTVMFPPPGYGGRDPRYVHEAKLVPKDRLGEYAALGFTLMPKAPLWTAKEFPLRCGILTNLGTVCDKRFETEAERYLHQRAKHPAELEALMRAAQEEERRREEERWRIERDERRAQLEYQRQIADMLREVLTRSPLPGAVASDSGGVAGATTATTTTTTTTMATVTGGTTGSAAGHAPPPPSASTPPAPPSANPHRTSAVAAHRPSSSTAPARPAPRTSEPGRTPPGPETGAAMGPAEGERPVTDFLARIVDALRAEHQSASSRRATGDTDGDGNGDGQAAAGTDRPRDDGGE